MTNYPNDADGAALERVAADGSDMAQPMEIDFTVAVLDEGTAQLVAAAVDKEGYSPSISCDPESEEWTVYCTRTMIAEYGALLACQRELSEVCGPIGGTPDGWGTFGNAAPE